MGVGGGAQSIYMSLKRGSTYMYLSIKMSTCWQPKYPQKSWIILSYKTR